VITAGWRDAGSCAARRCAASTAASCAATRPESFSHTYCLDSRVDGCTAFFCAARRPAAALTVQFGDRGYLLLAHMRLYS